MVGLNHPGGQGDRGKGGCMVGLNHPGGQGDRGKGGRMVGLNHPGGQGDRGKGGRTYSRTTSHLRYSTDVYNGNGIVGMAGNTHRLTV